MPNSDTPYRTGSDRAKTFPEDKPFQLSVVGRPNGNDLGVFYPLKCLIDPKARKGLVAKGTANCKDQIAASRERYMVSGWGYCLAISAIAKNIFHSFNRNVHE
ncbi:hypothetical protein D3C87_1945130 [compost metagenome]